MEGKVIIFGGTGFIGKVLCDILKQNNINASIVCSGSNGLSKVFENGIIKYSINICNKNELKTIVQKYDIAINLIGKLYEKNENEFEKFHHQFPSVLSSTLTENQKLIHISALGIENSCTVSKYAKTKLLGEEAVKRNSKNYAIIRPSIVFGECDNFFNMFAKMAKFSPFLPLIGGGNTQFAPIYVQDLCLAILKIMQSPEIKNTTFEAFGQETSTFKEILEFILQTTKRKRLLLNIPFSVAKIQAKTMNAFKIYTLTPDQIALLHHNNIPSKKHPSIKQLIGELKNYKEIVPKYLK